MANAVSPASFKSIAEDWAKQSRDLLSRTDLPGLLQFAEAAARYADAIVRQPFPENRYDPRRSLLSRVSRVEAAVKAIRQEGEQTRAAMRRLYTDVFTKEHEDGKTIADDIVGIASFFHQQAKQPGFAVSDLPEPEAVEKMMFSALQSRVQHHEAH